MTRFGAFLPLAALLAGCTWPPNNPYPGEAATANVLYASFEERPRHLDPARAYSSGEYEFIAQIYEPPLQYAWLQRPLTLEPLSLSELPQVTYLDANGHPLPTDTAPATIAYSEYDLRLKTGIRYQPHPAFVRDEAGGYRYHRLDAARLARIKTLADFAETASRERVAEDYAYAIKRLVHPAIHSPVAELMKDYIVGLRELEQTLKTAADVTDLRPFPLSGVQVLDDHRLKIRLYGKYPQFRFWLAMPFFAPIPFEADLFYAQTGLNDKNISLDVYPVGTGPFYLTENNPNRRMVLTRNPNYHPDHYPVSGSAEDQAEGLLVDAGQPLPFIDRVVFTLEKETIPYWNKFLQGYYDTSGLASDNFDQAIRLTGQEQASLTPEMTTKGIRLRTTVAVTSLYMGFNLLDPVVGGLDEAHCKLRQALSIAVDQEEFIAIFLNGRGVAAQGVIPPGLFGHVSGAAGINPYVYDWVDGQPRRKSLEVAKRLLAEAGYPGGIDPATRTHLVLYLDTAARGADDKASLNWYRKQFARLGIQLVFRATDYNQFQQKMQYGNAQIFQWGWNADYPDPENFLFLLYGGNLKVGKGGENAANYQNPAYDRLFEQMRNMDDTPDRHRIIQAMQNILRHDAPWVFGFHPKSFVLSHDWYLNRKPGPMTNNGLKYLRIDTALRARKRAEWNQPVLWPLLVIPVLLLIVIWPAWRTWRKRQQATIRVPD
jgi:ABC-type oligopeptide transport system substrate-binding subunit